MLIYFGAVDGGFIVSKIERKYIQIIRGRKDQSRNDCLRCFILNRIASHDLIHYLTLSLL